MHNQIRELTSQLYPNGRAFRMKEGSTLKRLHDALLLSESNALSAATGLFDSAFPDNDNFTVEDANIWEKKLGMINGAGVPLEDRKAAIRNRLNYPLTNAPRQYFKYIEDQLRSVGFDVRVYENKFPVLPDTDLVFTVNDQLELEVTGPDQELEDYQFSILNSDLQVNIAPGLPMRFEIIGSELHAFNLQPYTPAEWLVPIGSAEHSTTTYHGETEHSTTQNIGAYHDTDVYHSEELEHGAGFQNYVANHIDPSLDAPFIVGSNWKYTFYIAGEQMPDFAVVSEAREAEFRQLILRLKPLNTVGLLFVNYI